LRNLVLRGNLLLTQGQLNDLKKAMPYCGIFW